MADCPEAVPLFLKRMTSLGKLEGILVDSELSSLDVANLMKQLGLNDPEHIGFRLLGSKTARRCRNQNPDQCSFASKSQTLKHWASLRMAFHVISFPSI